MYEEVRLPASRFKGLSVETIEQHHCMLYSMYETEFDIRILHVDEQIKAVAAAGGRGSDTSAIGKGDADIDHRARGLYLRRQAGRAAPQFL